MVILVDQGAIAGVRSILVSFAITFVLSLSSHYWPGGDVRESITRIAAPPGARTTSKPLFSRGYLVITAFFWWIGTFLIFFTTNQNNTAYWVFVGLYGGYLILDKFWFRFYFYRQEEYGQTTGMVLVGGAFLLSVGMLVDFLVGQLVSRNTLCMGSPASPFVCGNYGIALAGAIVLFIHIVLYFTILRRVLDDWSSGNGPTNGKAKRKR